MRWGGVLGLLAALGASVPGCAEELDTTRVEQERGTLGAEIYEVVCQRIASEENPSDVSGRESRALCEGTAGPEAATTPRLRALAQNRTRLVGALDRILPESLEDDVGDFMLQLLPFYEPPDDRLPRQTRATAGVLTEIMNDEEALAALERLSTREGYRPLRLALGMARPLLSYPDFDDFATRALETIDEGGTAGAEWDQLLRAAALEMATAEPDPPETGETTLAITRRLLFTEDGDFAVGTPIWTSRRDDRGVVLVASSTGSVPPPFVDGDGDGLADVDVLGRFIDATGGALEVPTPFRLAYEGSGTARDPSGRALREDGSHWFASLDANRTMLGGLSREARPWFDPTAPVLMDMADGLPPLLGPRGARTASYGAATFSFDGPDTSAGALFDVIHAIGVLLPREHTDDVLALTDILVNEHEDLVAALIETGLFTDRRADTRDAALEHPSNLWDDLIQVVVWIAQEPGLLEAVLRSFAHPDSACLGMIYSDMMEHRDPVGLDPADMNAPRRNVVFDDDVERSMPDVEGNRSIFTRSLSVIHDLNGVRMCNKEGARLVIGPISWPIGGSYAECELIEVDNVAEMYAQAIIGRAELELKDRTLNTLLGLVGWLVSKDQLLEDMSGIDGLTTHPTAEALNRLVFAPPNDFIQNIMDPPVTRDGVPVAERHPDTVFAWEREYLCDGRRVSFYKAMTPILEAFDDYDRRTAGAGVTPGSDPTAPRFIFGELISALHLHWPSRDSDWTQRTDPSAPFFAHQSDAVSYEENVADAFGPGELLQRLYELSVALDGVEVHPGVDGIDVLAATTEDLVDPNRSVGLAALDGSTTTRVNDGSREVPVTPLYLLLDSLAAMDDAFAPEPERHGRWLSARGALVDQLLPVDCPGGTCALRNRRAAAMIRVLVPFFRERIAAHRDAGDLDEWALTMHERAADSLGGPMGASLLYFLDAVQRDPEARDALSSLVGYMVDEASANDAFATTLVALADLLQVLEDDLNLVPIIRALSRALAPDAPEVVAGGGELVLEGSATDEALNLLREINEVDERRVLEEIMANMVALPPGDEETPIEVLLDVIGEVNRADPGAGTRMTSEDYRSTFGHAHELLTSETRGFERLYQVIEDRELDR